VLDVCRLFVHTLRILARDYLTDFELMILLSILRVGDEAYGVPIAREMETTGGRTVVLSAVYAALERLEENGLVSSSLGAPTPERGGRAKRFFRVTPAGLKSVRQARRALTQLWTGLPQLEGGRP
jgi:PadR family transcriptional regulator, regulatory protein PadR